MEGEDEDARSSFLGAFRARPELGNGLVGQQTVCLEAEGLSRRSIGDAFQQGPVSVLSHGDGLPRYSTFTGPRLCGRRRPCGKGKSKKKRTNRDVFRSEGVVAVGEEEERVHAVPATSDRLMQEEEHSEELDNQCRMKPKIISVFSGCATLFLGSLRRL